MKTDDIIGYSKALFEWLQSYEHNGEKAYERIIKHGEVQPRFGGNLYELLKNIMTKGPEDKCYRVQMFVEIRVEEAPWPNLEEDNGL